MGDGVALAKSGEAHRFKKGQQSGRTKGTRNFSSVVREAAALMYDDGFLTTEDIDRLAMGCFIAVLLDPNHPHWPFASREFNQRIYGKVADKTEHTFAKQLEEGITLLPVREVIAELPLPKEVAPSASGNNGEGREGAIHDTLALGAAIGGDASPPETFGGLEPVGSAVAEGEATAEEAQTGPGAEAEDDRATDEGSDDPVDAPGHASGDVVDVADQPPHAYSEGKGNERSHSPDEADDQADGASEAEEEPVDVHVSAGAAILAELTHA